MTRLGRNRRIGIQTDMIMKSDQFMPGARQVQRAFSGVGDAANRAAAAINFAAVNLIGSKLGQAGRAVGGMFKDMTKHAMGMEAVEKQLSFILGSATQASELAETARTEALDIIASATDLMKGVRLSAQAGIRENRELLDTAKISIRLANVAGTQFETTHLSLIRGARLFKQEGENIVDASGKLADVMTQISLNSAVLLPDLIQLAPRVAGVAKQLDVAAPAAIGLAGAMQVGGLRAFTAATQFQKFLKVMLDQENALKIQRHLVPGFAKMIKTDLTGASMAFLKALKTKKGVEFVKTLDDIGIKNARMIPAIAGATINFDQMSAAIGEAQKAFDNYSASSSALIEQEEHRMNTFGGAMAKLAGSWKTLKEEFGRHLLPVLKPLAEALHKVVKWFRTWPDWIKKTVLIGGAFTLFALTAAGWVLRLAANIGFAVIAFQNLGHAMTKTAATGRVAMAQMGAGGAVGGSAAAAGGMMMIPGGGGGGGGGAGKPGFFARMGGRLTGAARRIPFFGRMIPAAGVAGAAMASAPRVVAPLNLTRARPGIGPGFGLSPKGRARADALRGQYPGHARHGYNAMGQRKVASFAERAKGLGRSGPVGGLRGLARVGARGGGMLATGLKMGGKAILGGAARILTGPIGWAWLGLDLVTGGGFTSTVVGALGTGLKAIGSGISRVWSGITGLFSSDSETKSLEAQWKKTPGRDLVAARSQVNRMLGFLPPQAREAVSQALLKKSKSRSDLSVDDVLRKWKQDHIAAGHRDWHYKDYHAGDSTHLGRGNVGAHKTTAEGYAAWGGMSAEKLMGAQATKVIYRGDAYDDIDKPISKASAAANDLVIRNYLTLDNEVVQVVTDRVGKDSAELSLQVVTDIARGL